MEAIMRPIGAIRLEGQRAYVDVLPQFSRRCAGWKNTAISTCCGGSMAVTPRIPGPRCK